MRPADRRIIGWETLILRNPFLLRDRNAGVLRLWIEDKKKYRKASAEVAKEN